MTKRKPSLIQTPISPQPQQNGNFEADKANALKAQVAEVTGILADNIEAYKRQDDLERGTCQFHRSGESARRRTWWQATKFKIFMFILVVLFVSTLTGAILFWKKPRAVKGTPIDNRDTEQGPEPPVESGPDP